MAVPATNGVQLKMALTGARPGSPDVAATSNCRPIIVGRFGLEGTREKTLELLGKELGITKERVRQLELRARGKLRALAEGQELDLRGVPGAERSGPLLLCVDPHPVAGLAVRFDDGLPCVPVDGCLDGYLSAGRQLVTCPLR